MLPPSGTIGSNPTNLPFSLAAPAATPYGTKSVALPLGPVTGIPGAKTVNGVVTVPVTSPVPTVPEVAKGERGGADRDEGHSGLWPELCLAVLQAHRRAGDPDQ